VQMRLTRSTTTAWLDLRGVAVLEVPVQPPS
jgi:hypothetical protein